MAKQQVEFQMEMLTAQQTRIEQLLTSLMQSPQGVSGKASALVALAKDSRLDGRVGAGDVVVSVMLAGGGLSIGVIGATGIFFGGIDVLSTGEMFSLGTLTGCGLGLLRMGIDALAIPLMLSNLMEWGAERWQEWLEHRAELIASGLPKTIERLVILNPQEDAPELWDIYDTPQASYKIRIKEETDRAKEIHWPYAKLWYFIEDCHRTGEWSRAKVRARWGNDNLSQGEHKAVSDFIKAKCPETDGIAALWGLKGERNRPTLHAYLERFRMPPSQLTSQPVNQPGENQ